MAGPWEAYQSAPSIKERDIEAGIDQSGASAESSRATTERTRALTPLEVQKVTAEIAGAQATATKQASENKEKEEKERAAKADAVRSLSSVIDKIDQVAFDSADNGGWFETGATGSTMRKYGPTGTAAFDLAENIKTIDANTAFNALKNMRATSPTGGALGNVTEKELELLKASVANLNPDQSQPQFFSNLASAKRTYLDMLRQLDPGAASSYAKKRGIRWDDKNQANLVYVEGEDKREPVDPMGLLGTSSQPKPPSPPPSDGFFRMPTSWEQFSRGLAQGAGDIVEGVGDFAGLAVNPAATVLGRSMGYGNYTADFGKTLRETVGLPDNPNAFASAINKGGVGALTGSLAARGASVLANPGAVQGALSQFSATPGRDLLAGAGAGAGGEIGREVGGVPGQVIGALAGGLAGYGGANAALRTGAPRTPDPLLQAADDLGVTMLPADVGGVGTRMATGGFGRTFGGIPIAEGAERSISTAAAARNRVAAQLGDAGDSARAGQATRSGFEQFEKNSRARGNELFEQVSVPGEAGVQLGQTRTALADVTRGMESNPELSRLWANHPRLRSTLEALTPKDVAAEGRVAFAEASDRLSALQDQYEAARNAITDPNDLAALRGQITQARQEMTTAKELIDTPPQGGQLSWQDMKRFRSTIGEIIGQPGVSRDGSDIAALRKLYGALTSDMEVTAAQAGPKALQEFRRANQYWRGRESRIDDVFSVLFGKNDNRSDEAVFEQINRWSQNKGGDFSRIARTMRSMPQDEADTIRATIVQRMGQAKPANQNATGEVFSPAVFSTQWHSMSNRAKNVLFPNKQHREDLEKLATITDAMKQAGQFQNFSNTSLGTNITAQGALAIANLPVAAALAGMQFGAGKLLASPRFARILASSAKLPPEQAGRRISDQLSVLATREPAMAADARALQQHLQQTFSGSPAPRVAAGEEDEDVRREPPR